MVLINWSGGRVVGVSLQAGKKLVGEFESFCKLTGVC